ncbi:MAG: sensor histidine kinase [Dehalococcoidia bacterium]
MRPRRAGRYDARTMDTAGAGSALENPTSRRPRLPMPQSFWQRRADPSLATLPGGIRLAVFTSPFIVRWAAWLVAVLIVAFAGLPDENMRLEPWLLLGTFAQTLAVTSYVPLVRPVLLPALRKRVQLADYTDVLLLGLADLGLSMLAVYLSGGWRSPYYHFALTALLIPSFFLTFRGVLGLGAGFMAAYALGLATVGEGIEGSWRDRNLNSFIGAIITPMLVALVPNYLGSVLRDLDAARQDAVDALADSDLLFRVARAFLEGGGALGSALPRVAATALEGSRFASLALLVPDDAGSRTHAYGLTLDGLPPPPELGERFAGDGAGSYVPSALPAPLDRAFEGCGWVAVAPLRSPDATEGWLIAGARERPSSVLHEVRLVDTVAGQIALGMRNIRLTRRIGELAAEGERTRIAREIHDGIAQMIYMLSLSLETAVDRVGGDPDEQRQRLKDLTALAKNALWEVRQYIFDLRPLLSGDAGLVGAVQGQLKEFQAVSELPVELSVTGEAARLPLATSAALYRIVQEGLGNIFRHARASKVDIAVTFSDGRVTLAIADDGVGMEEHGPDGRVGHGMSNLRRRVEDLHGTLDVRSTPGAGTCIEVMVPIGGDT